MRHDQLPDDQIKVRSVLMRLYHSRQMGEDFYPAQLVNGEAPKMESDGWIERHGEGWRLTDEGLQVWAEMNPAVAGYKYQYRQKMFDEMRERLTQGRSDMRFCTVTGCNNTRMVNGKGKELTMCDEHQHEYWRKQAAKKVTVANAVGKETKVETSAVVVPDEELMTMTSRLQPVEQDCETCEVKAVLEALRAKSPKLAKLIDAMQAEVEAAAELGL